MDLGVKWVFPVLILSAALFFAGCSSQDAESGDFQAELEAVFQENPELVLQVLQENRAILAELVRQGNQELEEKAWQAEILEQLQNPLQPEISPDRVIQGDPDAQITMVKYFNFQCPMCQTAGREIQSAMLSAPGQMRLVLKHVARDEISRTAARYFEAVAQQDKAKALKFKEMAFNQSSSLAQDTEQTLEEIVLDLELDQQRLQKDLESEEIQKRLHQDLEEARELGIPGTPVLLVNGVKIQGFISRQEIEDVVSMISGQAPSPGKGDFAIGDDADLCLEDFQDCN